MFFCDPPAETVGSPPTRPTPPNRTASAWPTLNPGRARMIVDEDHGYLLGVTFVGPGVEEADRLGHHRRGRQVPISRLWHAVPCFPSISEVWLRLLEAYGT